MQGPEGILAKKERKSPLTEPSSPRIAPPPEHPGKGVGEEISRGRRENEQSKGEKHADCLKRGDKSKHSEGQEARLQPSDTDSRGAGNRRIKEGEE